MTIAEHQQRSRQSTILVFILLTLAATRFIMGEFLRYYFISESGYDDQLMLTYSHITNHFRNPNYLSLVKTMSFPLFLNLITHQFCAGGFSCLDFCCPSILQIDPVFIQKSYLFLRRFRIHFISSGRL